jgi:nucleotide-binding universal stress UspA family protein
VSLRVVTGLVAPMLLKVAHDEAVDLVVMSTHGRSGLARVTLGSVATSVLERIQQPLVLICPRAQRALEAENDTVAHVR